MSSLPEIHLLPADLKAIIKLVKAHDSGIAEKLDESYHSASFNVTDSSGPVCFVSRVITHDEASKVQEWLVREENKGEITDEFKQYCHLAKQWRAVSARH